MEVRVFKCFDCKYEFSLPYGEPKPEVCPKCGSTNIHRIDSERGGRGFGGMGRGPHGGGRGYGRGRGGGGRGRGRGQGGWGGGFND